LLQFASGVTIPFPENIKEEFQVFEKSIIFNLSLKKIKLVIDDFLNQLSEPLFFVLEIPLSQQEETEIRKDNNNPFHKKVCYLDGQSKEQISAILQKYGDLLFNDGMSQFAIASHMTNDEIYIQKYKVITIYCNEPIKYVNLLKKHGLIQTDNLLTAWNTFSDETPGHVQTIELDGINVYDVYDELVKSGMYVAKIAED